ncbi:MAG: preprotein translocase subunit SecA [Chloroflexi bacterium]|nr:preprotein translocase subunit SecA [Chloroflexota bacterium]
MLKSLLSKVVGDSNERVLSKLWPNVEKINGLEAKLKDLTDAQMRALTGDFKARLARGESLDDILPEAFAAVREASRRTVGMRPFDVQLIGGMVLHQGKIAEMKTGEGKTLVATLPLYLNALTGKGVHLVTPNDYLSKVGVQWMGPIYYALGLSVGVIQHESAYLFDPAYSHHDARFHHLRPCAHRREAYYADITYGTNNEFGFDYLRDNMVWDSDERVQRDVNFAIVDEVDNILIDEARTPLIISGQADEATDLYRKFAAIAATLREEEDFTVDEKHRNVTLTEGGIDTVERKLGIDNLYAPESLEMTPYLDQALKARVLFLKDREYIVKEGQVIIVDEFTGRLMPGRRFSEGLHQAIEAKEGVQIQRESLTLATITFQNYFRMYEKLAGMTGTAKTEEEEFQKIYDLDVVLIPTHRPMVRTDHADQVYKTEQAKYRAVVNEIQEMHGQGRPVLVGTTSVERSEMLADMLKRRGVTHNVLNAKLHEKEAVIVAQAGRPGAVTLATNMAGRGVDILLGGNPDGLARDNLAKLALDVTTASPEQWDEALAKARAQTEADKKRIIELGGLHIIGTERHEARRIDNQLRGRAGRQGDPGSSRFYVSLEDDLMRRFGGEQVKKFMEWAGLEEDVPIEHNLISRTIEQSQVKVEGYNFDMRKHVLQYDDVVNQQRETIYEQRRRVLSKDSLRDDVMEMLGEAIDTAVDAHTGGDHEDWDLNALAADVQRTVPLPAGFDTKQWVKLDGEEIADQLMELAEQFYDEQAGRMGRQLFDHAQRNGLTIETLSAISPMLQRAVVQVAQARLGDAYATASAERLTGLTAERESALQALFTDGMVLSRDRIAILQVMDRLWIRHLTVLDDIREGIGLRAYGQQDPLVAYKREASESFGRLLDQMREQVAHTIFGMQINLQQTQPARVAREVATNRAAESEARGRRASAAGGAKGAKLGRNDPCWCGSGKKYKNCHMRKDLGGAPAAAQR